MATKAQLAATALAVSLALVAGAAQPPVVRVAADAPATVVGIGFREHESVRVTIVMGTRRFADAAVASAAGEFTVRFAGTRLDRCATPLVVSARGELTGLVTATLPPRECAAP
jgi:flagellar biosynthesis/type III secretory pathway ATPase